MIFQLCAEEGTEGEENVDAVEEGAGHMEEDDDRDEADHMHEDHKKKDFKQNKALPPEAKAALASGTLQLPYSNRFPFSPIVKCKGGCSDNVYCRLVVCFPTASLTQVWRGSEKGVRERSRRFFRNS